MVITCFVGTTPGVEVRDYDLSEAGGADLGEIKSELITWTSLHGGLAPGPGEQIWKLTRHFCQGRTWTWIGLYRHAAQLNQDRGGGFVGAGVLLPDLQVPGAALDIYLGEAVMLVSGLVLDGGRLVRRISSLPGSADLAWPASLAAVRAAPLAPTGGLRTDRLDRIYVDLSLPGAPTVAQVLELAQHHSAFSDIGRLFLGDAPALAEKARVTSGFRCLSIDEALRPAARPQTFEPPRVAHVAVLAQIQPTAAPPPIELAPFPVAEAEMTPELDGIRYQLQATERRAREDLDRFEQMTRGLQRENRWLLLANIPFTLALVALCAWFASSLLSKESTLQDRIAALEARNRIVAETSAGGPSQTNSAGAAASQGGEEADVQPPEAQPGAASTPASPQAHQAAGHIGRAHEGAGPKKKDIGAGGASGQAGETKTTPSPPSRTVEVPKSGAAKPAAPSVPAGSGTPPQAIAGAAPPKASAQPAEFGSTAKPAPSAPPAAKPEETPKPPPAATPPSAKATPAAKSAATSKGAPAKPSDHPAAEATGSKP